MYQIPSGRGFRNFNRIRKDVRITKLKTPLRVFLVEELTKENPFEINNEVSLIFAEKGKKTKYPIVYKKWTGKRAHELNEYAATCANEKDVLSTWFIYQGKKPLNALGKFSYKIRTGVYHGLKEVFFDFDLLIDKGTLVQIRNCEGKMMDIEKTRIYPLIKSRHVKKWKLGDADDKKYTYCLLPQSYPGEKNENEMKRETPKTWEWLNDFKDKLLETKLYQKMFSKNNSPFYSVYDLGDWDSKYKVVWKRMGFYPDFTVVSVTKDEKLGEKLVLPGNVLHFVPLDSLDEAHYVCAILNSSTIKKNLRGLSSKSKSGLSKTIVGKIRLDKFNPKDKIHKKLMKLSKRAHQLAERNKSSIEVKSQIDNLVEELYKRK